MPRPLIPDRRNAVLDAADQLMLADGFDGITVDQVARKAGIGKGAVYREFASKHDMMDALLTRCTRRLVGQVRARVTDSRQPVGLSGAYRFGLEALLDDPLMTAAFLDDEAVLGSHVRAVGSGRYVARLDWLATYLRELHSAGSLRTLAGPEAIGLALSAFTIGALSLPSTVGSITGEQLAAAVDAVIELVEQLEGPPTSEGSEALVRLLDQVAAQLDEVDSSTPASNPSARKARSRG